MKALTSSIGIAVFFIALLVLSGATYVLKETD